MQEQEQQPQQSQPSDAGATLRAFASRNDSTQQNSPAVTASTAQPSDAQNGQPPASHSPVPGTCVEDLPPPSQSQPAPPPLWQPALTLTSEDLSAEKLHSTAEIQLPSPSIEAAPDKAPAPLSLAGTAASQVAVPVLSAKPVSAASQAQPMPASLEALDLQKRDGQASPQLPQGETTPMGAEEKGPFAAGSAGDAPPSSPSLDPNLQAICPAPPPPPPPRPQFQWPPAACGGFPRASDDEARGQTLTQVTQCASLAQLHVRGLHMTPLPPVCCFVHPLTQAVTMLPTAMPLRHYGTLLSIKSAIYGNL